MPARYLNKGIVLWYLDLVVIKTKCQTMSSDLVREFRVLMTSKQNSVNYCVCCSSLCIVYKTRQEKGLVCCLLPCSQQSKTKPQQTLTPPLPILFTLKFEFQIALIHNYVSNTSFLPFYPSVSFFLFLDFSSLVSNDIQQLGFMGFSLSAVLMDNKSSALSHLYFNLREESISLNNSALKTDVRKQYRLWTPDFLLIPGF